jgi:hypothetical protein
VKKWAVVALIDPTPSDRTPAEVFLSREMLTD